MASRGKLRYKPKPVLGGAVRRARDKDEVPDIPLKQPSISSTTESPSLDLKADKTADTEPDPKVIFNERPAAKEKVSVTPLESNNCEKDITFSTEISTDRSAGIQTRSESIVNNKLNDHEISGVDKVEPTVTGDQVSVIDKDAVAIPALGNQSRHITPDITNKDLLPPNELNNTVIKPISSIVSVDKVNEENKGANINTKYFSKDEDASNIKLANKNVVKPSPRFARSKCKPILNASERKKTDSKTEPADVDLANVRTESVIKSVKEVTKPTSIVEEITESFSLLESTEDEQLIDSERETQVIVYSNHLKNTNVDHGDNQISDMSVDEGMHISIHQNTSKQHEESPNNKTEGLKSNEGTIKVIDKTQLNKTNNEHINLITPTSKVITSPLKSTSKMLVPKPTPRLSDVAPRRISFQGSDSEEEGKRKHIIIKNEPQKTLSKEGKEKNIKNSKRKLSLGSTYSKLGQETLDKFNKKFGKNKPPDRSKLTMLDLIFYNPKNNPMTVNPKTTSSVRKREAKMEVNESLEESLEEEAVDDVTEALGPRLMVGSDGQVVLDPKSVEIQATDMEKNRAKLENSQVIQDNGITRYSTYSKRKQLRSEWTTEETLQFYKALSTIGSDFETMSKLFPKRTRHELKLKFKKEEKTNMRLVDKAMTGQTDYDFKTLKEELRLENEEIEREALQKRLIAEAAKKERAERKEERMKRKKIKSKIIIKPGSALKDFNESDRGKIYSKEPQKRKHSIEHEKRKQTRRKRAKKSMMDSDLEMELNSDLEFNSQEEEAVEVDVALSILKRIKDATSSQVPKHVNKTLEEYEEMNETLKKKLHHESDSEEEGYIPNGPDAQMLFGSPPHGPDLENDEQEFNFEITTVPTIDETVMIDENVEEVSELSELGSFGQNDTALDLSIAMKGGEEQEHGHPSGILNRHLITHSIKIIDQLTSEVSATVMNDDDSYVDDGIILENPTRDPGESVESKIPLPSFESVSRCRPTMVYPVGPNFVPNHYEEENTMVTDKMCDSSGYRVAKDSNECEEKLAPVYQIDVVKICDPEMENKVSEWEETHENKVTLGQVREEEIIVDEVDSSGGQGNETDENEIGDYENSTVHRDLHTYNNDTEECILGD